MVVNIWCLNVMPCCVAKCVHSDIQVSKNQLRTYPSSLCNCKRLERLDFSNNSILALQGRIYEWSSLRHLDLRNNKLTVLPSAVGWLALDTLRVEGNPNMRIPSQVGFTPSPSIDTPRTALNL